MFTTINLDSLFANLVCILIVAVVSRFLLSRAKDLDGRERYEGREQRKIKR